MSVTSGFFNSLSGDRKYDAIQISSMFDGLITDGIYNGFLESFMVTASSPASMVVTVGEGRCWFNHTWTLNDAPLPLTLDVGDVVLNRIDTIVIDVDSTDTVRACTIKVVKGTPSSQAVRPTLENTETHHQYPLCDISVPAGATTVTQSNITNRRGTSDCPFVATLMKSVNVDDLLIQWESQWNDWMTDRANAMNSWTAEQQEAFTTWFQTVQDILDENTAGNLLNRINHRTGINATATYSAGVVAITAPDDAGEILTFVAPSDFLSSDTYTLNGEALTITDLNGEALDDSWKKNSPVTITVSGGKAFFKAGGSGKNDTLPPLLGNMTAEVVEGDENDTYTIKMDKLILDKTTEMVGGAQLEWGEEMPAKPGKGTGGIKTWTREEVLTSGESSTILLKDIPVSDADNTSTLILPEKSSEQAYIYVSENYEETGAACAFRGISTDDSQMRYRGDTFAIYTGNGNAKNYCDTFVENYLDASVLPYVVTADINSYQALSSVMQTVSANAFPLAAYEMGYTDLEAAIQAEGPLLPYFDGPTARADERNYYTRTGRDASNVVYVTSGGGMSYMKESSSSAYIRPAILLSPDTPFTDNGDGTYTFVGETSQSIRTMAETGTPVQLKDIPVSTAGSAVIVKIPEVDGEQEYLYLVNGYEGSNGGAAIRKNIPAKGNYSSTSSLFVNYGGSTIDTYFVDFAANNLTAEVKKFLVEAQVQARGGPYSRSCFALSDDELGVPKVAPVYGTEISYFGSDNARKATYQDAASSYWCRDTSGTGTASAAAIINDAGGVTVVYAANARNGFRPVILISLDAWFTDNGDGTYTFVGDEPASSEFVSHTVEVPHGQKVVFRQFTQNQKKQFQTMLVGGVYPPLGEVEPTFKLPEFTGNHAIFGDETSGRIELYESGTLTLYPGTYDLFLVGGGASGGNATDTSVQEHTGGGGGGYTTTISDIVVSKRSEFIATVGAGGNRSAGSQTIFENGSTTIKYTANGGAMVTGEYTANGGAGGSGGGGFNRDSGNGYAGGSDGSNGLGRTGGIGQGTTTRMFGEAGNTLFSGGGGGAGDGRNYYPGAGGAGGGGAAGNNVNGVAGTANTGGGGGGYSTVNTGARLQPGAGGSGIIIVRWNNAAQ